MHFPLSVKDDDFERFEYNFVIDKSVASFFSDIANMRDRGIFETSTLNLIKSSSYSPLTH